MSWNDPPPRNLPHEWTQGERRKQLSEFAALCAGIANGFADHDPLAAAEFHERAARAEALLAGGWSQSELNLLAGQFPMGAWWLHPKALDYDAPREPWQEEIAVKHARAKIVARDLRSVATYDA